MRFIQSIFAGAALVAAALAVEINEFPSEVQPGKSYVIKYTPGDSAPTSFLLRKGKNEDLKTIATLTTSATGGSFTWNVDSALPNADDYALQVKQGSDENYIGPIKLTGGSASVSPSASSSASASASASKSESESASASSGASTKTPSMTTASPSASASMSTPGSNSTVATATLSRTPSAGSTRSGSPTNTNSPGAPQNTGAASTLSSSPLALIFGAVAAFAYLN